MDPGGCFETRLQCPNRVCPPPCPKSAVAGTPWRRLTAGDHPACVGLRVQFDAATDCGTVVTRPAGCAFSLGELKWVNLSEYTCEMDDLFRSSGGTQAEWQRLAVRIDAAAGQLSLTSTLTVNSRAGTVSYVRP